MVSEQIVNDTVKRMLLSNIDEETIISTLADIGIDQAKAKEIIANVNSTSTQQNSQVRNSSSPDYGDKSDTDTKIASMQNEMQTQGEKTELHETATHAMLNDHAEKLDEVNKKVDEVHRVVSTPSDIDSSLRVRLEEIEKKTDDISAKTTALMELMNKILDANRDLLTELKSK